MKNKNSKKSLVGTIVLCVSLAGIFVGVTLILFGFIGDNETTITVGLIISLLGALFTFVSFFQVRDDGRRTCSKCGESLEGCEYQWQLVSEKYISPVSSSSYDRYDYVYQVYSTCPFCGETKSFTHKFSAKLGENPDAVISRYLHNLYKH